MTSIEEFKVSGIAIPKDAKAMLGQICSHFVEHAEVQRSGDRALLTSKSGSANIRVEDDNLLLELSCSTQKGLQAIRTMIAEHLFFFAGEQPLELSWADSAGLSSLPNIHEVTVLSAEDITPHMRRVIFACADVTPFVGGDMHVRLLVPPKGRAPIWPRMRADGRVAWPEGADELLVRVYTIRAVDTESRTLCIDFLQHPTHGIETPGADFARDVRPGQRVALLGPGAGGLPAAQSVLFAGDESALPAIARIAAEVPAGTRMQAIIEVFDEAEEQPLPTAGLLDIRWLHRKNYQADGEAGLAGEARKAIASIDDETFVWVACEKEDVRAIRAVLKDRQHDRKNMYVASYWARDSQ